MLQTRSVWLLICVPILVTLACSTTATGADAPTVTPVPLQATLAPSSDAPPPAEETPLQADQPVSGNGPVFVGPIRFATDPNNPGSQRAFSAGVQEIWAVWDYAGMSDGDVIRRVWYLNGQEWLVREEAWDFAKYGSSGSVRDISVYDHESADGLEAGEYRLQLFINGVSQFPLEATDVVAFSIANGRVEGDILFPAPDLSRTAIIQQPGTLLLSGNDGSTKTLTQQVEITDVEWFPDGQHLLYVSFNGANQAPQNRAWEMWVVNVDNEQSWQISQGDEQLRDPDISPQGDVIAVVAGSGYGDAGFIDQQFACMYLTLDLQRSALVFAREFQGIPDDSGGSVHPATDGVTPLPGQWESISEFHAIMNMTWPVDDFQPGVYAFFILDRMAGRIDELPEDVKAFE